MKTKNCFVLLCVVAVGMVLLLQGLQTFMDIKFLLFLYVCVKAVF